MTPAASSAFRTAKLPLPASPIARLDPAVQYTVPIASETLNVQAAYRIYQRPSRMLVGRTIDDLLV